MAAIELHKVSKRFRAYSNRNDRWLRRELLAAFHQKDRTRDYWTVLENVNLEVHEGESVGLVGRNGTGKSTLLKLVAGILQPTSGRVTVNGSMCALLELGAGFSLDLTGKENVFLYGTILGLGEDYIRRVLPDILDFAELDGFMDTPLKYYSSGMRARLGFGVAMSADPEIFLIDEVLAVGDEGFRRKCYERLEGLVSRRKTIVMVSHDLDTIRRLCARVVWVDGGYIQADGPVARVVDAYEASFISQDVVEACQ